MQDETYIGTLVQGKQGTPHYKIKQMEQRPSSEWIRVPDAHEPLIAKQDFELVQRIRRLDTRTSPKQDTVYLFSGILICGCCGSRMTRKYAKMQRGEYQSKVCPYGYRKSADGRMEPNPETAAVVQLIFQLAATGIGAAAVTRELFKRGIPTPGEYKAAHGQQYHDVSRSRGRWSSSTVLRILEDERYIGSYVIGRRAVIEVGGTRSRRKDRDEWIIIPNHHPAIVDKELFEKVQAVQRRFSLPNKKTREYPLKGKVYCGCCDHALSRIAQSHPCP